MEKYINLGIAKAIVSNKVTNEFISESKIGNSKGLVSRLVETIKKSPVLMDEYNLLESIENKYIDNDIMASKFIDESIKRFPDYGLGVSEAHKLLKEFIDEDSLKQISESKIQLYNSIDTLISNKGGGDLNEMHSAYEYVFNYIRENVEEKEEESSLELNESIDLDSVVEVATRMYNEKYSSLNESERNLVNTIVNSSTDEKKALFEGLKNTNIKSLESIESNGVEDKINEAIDKLNKMVFSENTIAKDIVELTNLKESLS